MRDARSTSPAGHLLWKVTAFALFVVFLILAGLFVYLAWYVAVAAVATVYTVNALSRPADRRRLTGSSLLATTSALAVADAGLGILCG
jgi:hypothetical protein